MPKKKIQTQILQKGRPPVCLKTYQQCRGCYGWRNMLNAARSESAWQGIAFRCLLTGLTLQVDARVHSTAVHT